jgi:hypothetical protein
LEGIAGDDKLDQIDDELKEVGIENNNLFWSFEPYDKFLICLIIIYAIYFSTNYLLRRMPGLKILAKILKQKLFFSASIRFLIEGYLTITHNAIFFLYLKADFTSTKTTFTTSLTILVICLILIWPLFMTFFLFYNRG